MARCDEKFAQKLTTRASVRDRTKRVARKRGGNLVDFAPSLTYTYTLKFREF